MDKSKNHQMFTTTHEFFHADHPCTDMYYAPLSSKGFDTYGYRLGARFFCTKMCWSYFGEKMALALSGKDVWKDGKG